MLFYEAQRSGELRNNRIPWRDDSALQDAGWEDEDLTGGYYDGHNYVKFGFTMAFTTTILAWGAVSWPEAFNVANQLDEMHKTIKWATDYFIKCHVKENELYGQVGEFYLTETFWGRPEELPYDMYRPAYKINPEHPGRSYVVGYGINAPQQPRHIASSCPHLPKWCGWKQYRKNESNPQILYGALVSGPNENDEFLDIRYEPDYTNVRIDYNAGFTCVLAKLLQLHSWRSCMSPFSYDRLFN
ncbi:Endoglucanase E-4 [Camponotus floridanus]|uniref:cellulase n=1 Tax=Camponotus floridanus TaxID=104421 RepID=E2AQ45_CAMFO|nr:Endoglucanase E-4 [Camponotus floridanus]